MSLVAKCTGVFEAAEVNGVKSVKCETGTVFKGGGLCSNFYGFEMFRMNELISIPPSGNPR